MGYLLKKIWTKAQVIMRYGPGFLGDDILAKEPKETVDHSKCAERG